MPWSIDHVEGLPPKYTAIHYTEDVDEGNTDAQHQSPFVLLFFSPLFPPISPPITSSILCLQLAGVQLAGPECGAGPDRAAVRGEGQPGVNHGLTVVNHGLIVVNHGLPVVNHGLTVVNPGGFWSSS